MKLEDFFTLPEMKDGLISHSRVEELISVMERDKDCIVNVNEAARQWSSVASTLAATENRDSLDHFIRLNGLLFLDRWLQEAQKVSSDACDNSVETSISLLLGALKKLPIDSKRSISSGIGVTVKKLFAHKNFGVQERARALLSRWSQESDYYKEKQDTEEVGKFIEDRVKKGDGTASAESWCHQSPSCDNTLTERNTDGNLISEEHQDTSDRSQHKSTGDLNFTVTKDPNHSSLDQEYKEAASRENTQNLSVLSNGINSVVEETSKCPADTEMGSQGEISKKERGPVSVSVSASSGSRSGSGSGSGSGSISPPDSVSAQQPVMRPNVSSNTSVKDSKNCIEETLPDSVDGDSCISVTVYKSVAGEPGILKHLENAELEVTYKVGRSCSDVMHNSSSEGRNSDNLDNTNSKKHDPETTEDVEQLSGELKLKAGKTYRTTTAISSPEIGANFSEVKTKSDLDFDYGFDDALEVARQVAKEAEREVVDYRKQFCSSSSSSSERASEGGVLQPGSPDSINDEQNQTVGQLLDESPLIQSVTGKSLTPDVEDQLMNSEFVDRTQNCIQKDDSPQGTEVFEKPSDEGKINLCDFDLNELCSEEVDHAIVTFVSASKVAPAGVPKAPLHFEGELGWKGSAATSAFRPAHSSRIPDCGKPLSVVGSSQSSKQRQVFLDIDLNVTEGDADGASHPVMDEKQVPVSSDLRSGESFVEVSSRRAQRLKLDLNRIGDNEENPSSDGRMEERYIYHQPVGSPSPASSTSSRQFPARNIDLNGNPSLFDDSSDRQPGYGKCFIAGGFKADDPVVSIMGARVAINRPGHSPQTQTFLPSGRGVESPVLSRAENGSRSQHSSGYTHPPPSLFGYSGFGMGSSPPAIYGPGSVPCMVDSRGAPIVPQMIAAASSVGPPSQLPFFMNMSRPSLDLNSGLTMVESESAGGFRQLFIPGQGLLMEEQMRSASQHIGPPMKRKETDGGWDLYPGGYKHQPPWF